MIGDGIARLSRSTCAGSKPIQSTTASKEVPASALEAAGASSMPTASVLTPAGEWTAYVTRCCRATNRVHCAYSEEDIVFMGVAQEKAQVFQSKKMDGQFQFTRDKTVYVNHYYFYINDADFGSLFICLRRSFLVRKVFCFQRSVFRSHLVEVIKGNGPSKLAT